MTFWLIAAGIASLMTGAALSPFLIARRRRPDDQAQEITFYKSQLNEIDAEFASGAMNATTHSQLHLEISRRLLVADRRATQAASNKRIPLPVRLTVLICALAVVPCALVIHSHVGQPGQPDQPLAKRIAAAESMRRNRPEQAEFIAEQDLRPPAVQSSDSEDARLIMRLRETVAARPDDLLGQRLLADSEAALGNFTAAAEAMAQVTALLGAQAEAADYAMTGQFLVAAAEGYVSPQAEAAFRAALDREPSNRLSRRYIGSMHLQNGRPDLAFRIWSELLSEESIDDGMATELARQLRFAAISAGLDGTQDPFEQALAQAARLPPRERLEFFQGVIEKLTIRLQEDGGSPKDWGHLIISNAVTGDLDSALLAYNQALAIFDGDQEIIDRLTQIAADAGLRP